MAEIGRSQCCHPDQAAAIGREDGVPLLVEIPLASLGNCNTLAEPVAKRDIRSAEIPFHPTTEPSDVTNRHAPTRSPRTAYTLGRRGRTNAHASLADSEQDADRVRVRQQHLDGRPRGRSRQAAHELPRDHRESEVLARRQADRVQRPVRRQRRRVRRAGRGGRTEAAHLASRRRYRARLDARRKIDRVSIGTRVRCADGDSAVLDSAGGRRRRNTDGVAARVYRQGVA